MDVADPFRAISSTTRLFFWTLGGPAPAASPSKADEALIRGISGTLKGYTELIEQSKIAMRIYQDDEGKDMAAANFNNYQQGRRPPGERNRRRFTMKHPMTPSKVSPVVDRSVLKAIMDPDEFFTKAAQLDEAEAEIKRLKGEAHRRRTINFEPICERKRRNPSRQKKCYSFNSDSLSSSDGDTMLPASKLENIKESQMSQDDEHASVYEKNMQSVRSRSNKRAISDNLVKEDSFAGKDKGDEITNMMASYQNFEGSNKLDFLRKSIGVGKIGMEKIYRRDSVLGDMSLGSTARMNPMEVTQESSLPGSHEALCSELLKHMFGDAPVDKHKDLSKGDGFEGHTLEGPLPGSNQARVSQSAERISGDAAIAKHIDVLKDDEFEGSPDLSDVYLMSNGTFSAREKDLESPGSCAKSAEHLDPEPNMPDCATIDDDPCSRHTISSEEDNVPVGYSVNDKSNNEAVISSHHLEDASAEVLATTPGRDVAPDDIARTPHSSENSILHQEVVEEDGVVQAHKSVHSSEMPLEDIGPQNQSQTPEETSEKLRADLASALSPTKEKTQKAAQQRKNRQQPKRKKVADESSHSLEMPQAESENQPHTHDANTEKSAVSPTKEKTQKAVQRGGKKQQQKRGKKVADESHQEIPQSDFDSENQPHTRDVNTEQQTVVMRNEPSPNKAYGQKEGQTRKRKRFQKVNRRDSLEDAGLKWQSGVRRSTRIRHRPLAYWCGERFVYGRIHNTLVTVIGVKSYSSGGDGESALEVKSFVPEQYSDIVARGAKY